MIKPFLVSFITFSPLRVGGSSPQELQIIEHVWHFKDEEIKIQIYDITDLTSILHNGIRIDISLSATDVDNAIDRAGGIADGFASFLSISNMIWVSPVRFDLAYDTSNGINTRQYVREFVVDDVFWHAAKKVKLDRYLPIVRAYEALEEKLPSISQKDRELFLGIHRAMSWFRKALLEPSDPVDEFISYWIVLECLNPLFSPEETRRRCTVCGKPLTKCSECGNDPQIFAARLTGIEKLYEKFGLSKREFDNLTSLRGRVSHGKGTLRLPRSSSSLPLAVEIDQQIPLIRSFAIGVLGEALGLDSSVVDALRADKPLRGSDWIKIRITAFIDIHEQARGSLKIQASLDLKLGKYYFKKGEYSCPLHSPTCKHVVLCPSGFE